MRSGYKVIIPSWLLESLQGALSPSTWMVSRVVHDCYQLSVGYTLTLDPSDAWVINDGYIPQPQSLTTSSNTSDWSLACRPLSLQRYIIYQR